MIQPIASHESSPIELIIFDCDGVLVDSEILSQRVLLDMLKELGANVSADYFFEHFLGYNFEHVTNKVFEDFSVTLTNEFRFSYRDKLKQVFIEELESTKDLMWFLSQLNVKSCVATSGSPEKVKTSLTTTKLNDFFIDKVFTSSEVKHGKPAPDLFLHAADKMGISYKNCLVIEDSPTGIKAALAASMNVLHYVGASHMKNRATEINKSVGAINKLKHWREFFLHYPSLNSSFPIER